MAGIPLWQVDAFTNQPFAGNPAAVCLLDQEHEASWMQSVAAEMNLSETAFIRPGNEGFELRWFTPTVEVNLCGHATLASAFVLWEMGIAARERPIRFHTRSGLLTASHSEHLVSLDFPAISVEECDAPPELLEALRVEPRFVARTKFDRFLVADSAKTVRALQPDFKLLAQVAARGTIVTAPSDVPGVDFISRFFAPASGIDEDPVTGSAHCALAPYWGRQLGKDRMVGFQASSRGGTVFVEVQGDRVILGGQVALVLKGELACQ